MEPSAPPVPRFHRPRGPGRLAAALLCLVLGVGLIGGAAVGSALGGSSPEVPADQLLFDERRALWREMPVDELFPVEMSGESVGPGGADRVWKRVAVAPDSDCDAAFGGEPPEPLADAGCHRLLRASYLDATETSVTTVGIYVTEAGPGETGALRAHFEEDGLASAPESLPFHLGPLGDPPGDGVSAEAVDDPAAGSDDADDPARGEAGRATWSIRALADAPIVIYTVTGFTDGRETGEAQPAREAVADGADSVAALAGLGHDASGIADRVERRLRKAAEEVEVSGDR